MKISKTNRNTEPANHFAEVLRKMGFQPVKRTQLTGNEISFIFDPRVNNIISVFMRKSDEDANMNFIFNALMSYGDKKPLIHLYDDNTQEILEYESLLYDAITGYAVENTTIGGVDYKVFHLHILTENIYDSAKLVEDAITQHSERVHLDEKVLIGISPDALKFFLRISTSKREIPEQRS